MSTGGLGGDDPEMDEPLDENADAHSPTDKNAPASDASAAWASMAPPDRALGATPDYAPPDIGSNPWLDLQARLRDAPPADPPPPAMSPAWASIAPPDRGAGAPPAYIPPDPGVNPLLGLQTRLNAATAADSPPADTPPDWVSVAPPDRMDAKAPAAPVPPSQDQQTPMDGLPTDAPAAGSASQPEASSLVRNTPAGDPYLSAEDGRWKQRVRDPATDIMGDVDVLHAGLARIDRSAGTIYANSSQGPIPIGIDKPAAALARIVQRRNENDQDDEGASNAGTDGGVEDADNPEPLGPAKDLARLAQIHAQMQNYGGVPQRLEAGIAALQAGLSGSAPDDPGTQPARERLARAQSVLAEWKQAHPDYTALSREQAAIQASVSAQRDAQHQSDARIKASLAMPETVRMNGALPLDPRPALGPRDVSLSAVQQRAGDLAGQMQIAPSAALRAALVEAKNRGATTVGGADITEAIRNARPSQPKNAGLTPATSEPKEDSSQSLPLKQRAPTKKPIAQRVADLHDQATALSDQIAAAQGAGTPKAIGDLAAHLDAEKDNQAQFHQATQALLDTVPANLRTRIERGTAPGLDHAAIRARNREDPTHSFATSEIGNALRDHYLPDLIQRNIRKKAQVLGVDPALAERIADQTIGARVVSDLETILRGGSIKSGKARILKQIGLLKPARMLDGTRRLAITDDVLPLLFQEHAGRRG